MIPFVSTGPLAHLRGILLLACMAPLAALCQSKGKGPLYTDNVVLTYKNNFAVRVPALFYANAFLGGAYKDNQLPILLGARFEHLFTSTIGVGLEWEYNSYDPIPRSVPVGQRSDPYIAYKYQEQVTNKFSPFMKVYFRGKRTKKKIYSGVFLDVGLNVYSIQQDLEKAHWTLHGISPNQEKVYTYHSSWNLGAHLSPGLALTFRQITLSSQVELLFSPKQFKQEGYYGLNVANGAVMVNPFKFYMGYMF